MDLTLTICYKWVFKIKNNKCFDTVEYKLVVHSIKNIAVFKFWQNKFKTAQSYLCPKLHSNVYVRVYVYKPMHAHSSACTCYNNNESQANQ